MYSNSKKGFSILDLLVKIIFAALFIFLLIWLFNKKIPNVNMKPFYSNVFRENIKYMQDAGEAYFTDDKMPQEVGQSIQLSLAEMEERNLVLPFVDQDGNECDKNASYVSVTKLDVGYELKTNLSCGKESNYVNKILGCHTYCKDNSCKKQCTVEKITKYQFRKLVNGTKTNYSCGKGYTLKGKYCYKNTVIDTKDATTKPATVKVLTKDAIVDQSAAVKKQLTTIVKDVETEVSVNKNTKETEVSANKTTTPAVTKKVKVPYDCTKQKTEKQCSTSYQSYSYSCNCSTTVSHGRSTTTCSTCYGSTPVTSCRDAVVNYTDTCYREEEQVVTPAQTTYTCPSNATRQTGSGSSLKCYVSSTTYTCPSSATRQTGSGSSLKCYKTTKSYSCPSETTTQEGSGSSLKCYKVISGSISYRCTDGYKLDSTGKKCTKTVTTPSTEKECKDSGYKLVGSKCILYKSSKVKATAKKTKTSYYIYKWSKNETLDGYTFTGKTKVVKGKEVCY